MKVPHIKYIEALICSKFQRDTIIEKLEEQEFFIPFNGIDQVHEVLAKLNPDYIINNQPDPDWLIELGVDKMVTYLRKLEMPNGADGIEGAFRILEDPLMYRLITSLALAKITDEDIELIVNGKFNINYSSGDIQEFLHYFFNVKSWTLTDKLEYIELVQNPDLKRFYKMALKEDKDHLVWKLGAAPNKTFDTILKEIMTDSFYNFKEMSKTNPEMAQKWGTLALRTVEKLEKLEQTTNEKRDLFNEISFKLNQSSKEDNKNNFKHISELDNEK